MKKILLNVIALITLLVTTLFAGCVTQGELTDADMPSYVTGDEIPSDEYTENTQDGETTESQDGVESNAQSLVIPVSELTSTVKFYGMTVDGTYVEVLAFKNGTTYRTAFNTCQVCYGSRTAYFKQSGNYLVCQNCGSRFALTTVGLKTSSYTCSPYPILDTDRTYDGENIIISYDFLVSAKNMFRTWKVV